MKKKIKLIDGFFLVVLVIGVVLGVSLVKYTKIFDTRAQEADESTTEFTPQIDSEDFTSTDENTIQNDQDKEAEYSTSKDGDTNSSGASFFYVYDDGTIRKYSDPSYVGAKINQDGTIHVSKKTGAGATFFYVDNDGKIHQNVNGKNISSDKCE